MATPNYIALRNKIRSWANRDEEVLSNDVIRDCVQFAADKAYRTLQIPAIEKTFTYTVDVSLSELDTEPNYQDWVDGNYLPVPPDLTRFIYVRKVSGHGVINPAGLTDRDGVVMNTKIHSRSYADSEFVMNDEQYFAVQEDKIRIPKVIAVTDGDVFEVAYYGRLSAMDEEYDVSDENYEQGIYASAPASASTNPWSGTIFNDPSLIQTEFTTELNDPNDPEDVQVTSTTNKNLYYDFIDLQNLVSTGGAKPTENLSADWIYTEGTHNDPEGDVVLTDQWTSADLQRWWNVHGIEVANWLRDEQQKVVLFGSLMEIAKYLGDSEMEARYKMEFEEEVRLLNLEEQFRITSGANTTLGFQGYGLI